MWLDYYLYQEENNLYYSIDMITLEFSYSPDLYDFLQSLLSRYHDNYDCEYFQSLKVYSFRHLFKFTFYSNDIFCNKSVLIIKFDFNHQKIGQIEFNPNKVMLNSYFIDFFRAVRVHLDSLSFKKCDFALDIPLQRQLVVLKKDQRKYSRIEYGGALTEYLGQRNKNNHVKLYDKQKEADLPHPLTRLEVTYESDNILKFPDVYIRKDLELCDDLSNKDSVFLSALLALDNPLVYVRRIKNYNTRKRFEELIINHMDNIQVNEEIFYNLLIELQKELLFSLS